MSVSPEHPTTTRATDSSPTQHQDARPDPGSTSGPDAQRAADGQPDAAHASAGSGQDAHPESAGTARPESGDGQPTSGDAQPTPPTPAATPTPQAPEPAKPAPVKLDEQTQREAEQAMEAATAPEPETPDQTGAPDAAPHHDHAAPPAHDEVHRPKKVWGPRVVEGGREHRKGEVVSVGPDAVFLEFGPKELGIIERSNLKEEQVPKVGDQIEVVIDRFDTTESLYFCSLPGQVQKAEWELLERGQIVEAMVTGHNKGGLELEVAHHRAFMPASQIDVHRVENLAQFVGQKLTCKVTRVDRSGRGNITLSRRDVLAEQRKEQVKQLRETLHEGQEIEGEIRKIMPFGAFIDMGGVDGLLHISDISHERVAKVEDHLKEGERVTVKILRLDWEKGRHSLGLKQLQPDPYEEALKSVTEGETVTGRVTKLLEFGCFVEIADGVEGLVHISELDWRRVQKTSDAVQPNTTVKVKVLKVDADSKKISLSIKQAKERPEQPAGRGGPGGRGGRGRRGRRGEQERDDRKAEEILKETPEFRRLREQAKAREKKKEKRGVKEVGGLGSSKGMGLGLGDLKL